jgi:multidrug efflux pump subunit AcrA (membrane-fusion protein)
VARVAPVLREGSRQARIEIEVHNEATLLKPGMFIRAEVDYARHENAVLAPVTALMTRQGRPGVFLADAVEKKAQFVPVTVGIVQGAKAEIVEPALSGLVVTLGQHLLTTGAEIVLPESAPKAERAGGGKTGR